MQSTKEYMSPNPKTSAVSYINFRFFELHNQAGAKFVNNQNARLDLFALQKTKQK